jgi:hypothetical protein
VIDAKMLGAAGIGIVVLISADCICGFIFMTAVINSNGPSLG